MTAHGFFVAPPRLLALLLAISSLGCGSGTPEPPARVNGVVTVKGKPVAGIRVTLHPRGEAASPLLSTGETNAEGKFAVSNVPPGEYAVTFFKIAFDPRDNETEIDGFKGKYADPAASKFVVTVAEGDNALPPFALD